MAAVIKSSFFFCTLSFDVMAKPLSCDSIWISERRERRHCTEERIDILVPKNICELFNPGLTSCPSPDLSLVVFVGREEKHPYSRYSFSCFAMTISDDSWQFCSASNQSENMFLSIFSWFIDRDCFPLLRRAERSWNICSSSRIALLIRDLKSSRSNSTTVSEFRMNSFSFQVILVYGINRWRSNGSTRMLICSVVTVIELFWPATQQVPAMWCCFQVNIVDHSIPEHSSSWICLASRNCRGMVKRIISQSGTGLAPWSINHRPMKLIERLSREFDCQRANESEMFQCIYRLLENSQGDFYRLHLSLSIGEYPRAKSSPWKTSLFSC